jgi:transposase
VRRAELFIAVLGASNYTFAEATWTQQLPDWIGSHIRAFEFMGSVPALLVPDNLKSAIKRACRYEPEATSTYTDMARHYATAILPARPFRPVTKPPWRRACSWPRGGSWRGFATASSSRSPNSTRRSARCWSI